MVSASLPVRNCNCNLNRTLCQINLSYRKCTYVYLGVNNNYCKLQESSLPAQCHRTPTQLNSLKLFVYVLFITSDFDVLKMTCVNVNVFDSDGVDLI